MVQYCPQFIISKLALMNWYSLLLLLLMVHEATSMDFKTVELRQDWKMVITQCPNQLSNLIGKEFNVTVPSTIHLNLQKYNIIPNPYFKQNLKSLASISECSAKFIKIFAIDQSLSLYQKVSLKFEGIDTYSTVYINNIQLGNTQNAFIKYEYDIVAHLKKGNNLIVVDLRSSKPVDAERQKINQMPFEYAHTRKACYQYSWDWAPYMNTLGIWLPVHLVFYKQTKLQYVWIRNQEVSRQKAILDFTFALEGGEKSQEWKNSPFLVRLINTNSRQEFRFKVSSKYSRFNLTVKEPRLWWPNNIGQPYVYQFLAILTRNHEILDTKKVVYGIRTVKLNSQGTNFQIIVNGYPIYCKGANYVPPDMMYPRLINTDFQPGNKIQSLLNDAVESNFNMLRVWGGGQYESQEFYEMASRKGIMIFQDFMFSDSIYPGTDQFLQNVRNEVVYQVRRLRNYPAIVLWSGNNQILQGIVAWGWGMPKYQEYYRRLFLQLIPDILNIECNYIPYIESSPSKGVGNSGFEQGGDIHYWGVWAAASAFETYQTGYGGFNSEFGTQSLPVWQTILQFTEPNGRMYQSQQFGFHERHSSRFSTLRGYISRYSKQSLNFQLEAYNSGLVQAYGMQIALRAQRCSKPKSFGTLYWQFNDAWPAISWSSIDYYGRWKPLQFLAKKYYKDVILFYHHLSGNLVAINDKLIGIKANYFVKLITFAGRVLFQDSGYVDLKVNQVRNLYVLQRSLYEGQEDKSFIYTQIVYGQQEDNRTALTSFFLPLKDLNLEPATLNVRYLYESNQIILQSGYLIKSLYISNTKQYLKFSDNYFDVVPGLTKKVKIIKPPIPLEQLKATMAFKSYRQIYDPAGLSLNIQN